MDIKIDQILQWFRMRREKVAYFFIGIFIIAVMYLFFHTPPVGFPIDQVFTVTTGESLQNIADNLYDNNIIRSPFFFRAHVILQGAENRVMAGDYLLDRREGSADLAYRLVHGQFNVDSIKTTIPEGWNVFQISDYLKKNLINFDLVRFIFLAKSKEGYLFPDTYFLSQTSKPEAIIALMSNNFDAKIASVYGPATSTRVLGGQKRNLKDVITMASILENEARTTDSRRIIAGILWKRLSLGMPLQVDSTFSYINGKNTYDLTLDDLKIDSPYNTYMYRGLPPGPISNPGVDAITDAITPITTQYLYFLSSRSGKMYYATTFEQHKRNKELYLNK
ncbi:MAG TPA: endolytic transglycosylase MltG [Candidatus Paceibacterota bacterium]